MPNDTTDANRRVSLRSPQLVEVRNKLAFLKVVFNLGNTFQPKLNRLIINLFVSFIWPTSPSDSTARMSSERSHSSSAYTSKLNAADIVRTDRNRLIFLPRCCLCDLHFHVRLKIENEIRSLNRLNFRVFISPPVKFIHRFLSTADPIKIFVYKTLFNLYINRTYIFKTTKFHCEPPG